MKKFLTLFFVGALFQSLAFAQDRITLYEDCEYRGDSEQFTVGRYRLTGMRVGARELSSLRVPNGMKVILYDGMEPGTGSKTTIYSDERCLSREWNDRARAMVVERDYNSGGNNNSGNNYYGGVEIFDRCNFNGDRKTLGEGWYNMNDLIGNDRVSSIRIPRGYRVTAFKDQDFKGAKINYYVDVSCLYGSWDNAISSIQVVRTGNYNNNNNNSGGGRYDEDGDAVTVYEDCNFRGKNSALREGSYKHDKMGVGGDKISSIRIPRGFRVVVYVDTDFKGYRREYTTTQECLTVDMNDKISSIEVFRRY